MKTMTEELRGAMLVSHLSPEQLERVARRALRCRLEDGQLLFSQADPFDRFYLVLAGQVRLYRLSPEGTEKVIEIIGPGETFAEALMFMNAARYPVCAAALGPTELIGMDSRDFARMLRESVDTCLLLLGDLSQRLKGLVREIDNITLHSATSRFASYLLSRRPSAGEELSLDMRKGIIASRLSIKPETFSRIEKDLSARGIIAIQGMRVRILDLKALERLAGLGEFQELAPLPCAPGHSG
jgi:CRP-like cAMP-binding protein